MTRTLSLMMMTLMLVLIGAQAVAEDKPQQASLSIPNMVCMSCEMRVEKAVTAVAGVLGIEFNTEANIAEISYDPDQTSLEAILAACDQAGYPATVIEPVDT